MLVSAVSMNGVIPAVKNSPKSNSNYASNVSNLSFDIVNFSSSAGAMRRKLEQAGVRVKEGTSKAELRALRDRAGVGGGAVPKKHVEPGEESCPTADETLACYHRLKSRGLFRPDGTFDNRKFWGI